MQNVLTVVVGYLGKISLPGLGVIDIIEIGLISFFVYQFMAWIKFTRAYTLLKGILIVLGFILVAYIFKMNTILWIFRNLANVLVIGVIANFILGVLMTAGIGLYAPCMALVLLLGMSADVAFPIMMGSCAFLCPACGITFIKEGKYQRAMTIPMIITGSIGVLIAGFIVTSLPLTLLTYLVCVVMVICAILFFHDARKQSK